MRLASLRLEQYGLFERLVLPLDPTPGRINLLAAPNGAGKSVLRQAFRDLLFGIPAQSPMGFRFGYRGMRIYGEALDGDGRTVVIGRRKGNASTLIDGSGTPLDPLTLRQLMGPADEALWQRLFALDTGLLRDGAEAMLRADGDLAEALFAAGSGIAGIRRIREGLESARDALAPQRAARARPLYQALDAVAEARSRLHAATIRPQDWEAVTQRIGFMGERRRHLVDEQARGKSDIERLQRLKRVRPLLDRLREARAESDGLADAPLLPPETARQWHAAVRSLELLRQEARQAEGRLADIARRAASEQPDALILAEADRIDGLARDLGAVDSDHRDLPKREAERNALTLRLQELMSELGRSLPEAGGRALPRAPEIAAARQLIGRHAALTHAAGAARERDLQAARDLAEAEAALCRMPPPEAIGDLRALVEEARAGGDPLARLGDAAGRAAQEEVRLATALARVPLWRGDAAALAALVPPPRAAVDRQAKALEAAGAAEAEAARELARLCRERDAAARRLAGFRDGRPLPDAAAVAAARAHRDRGWSLIRRAKFEGADNGAAIEAYRGRLPLPAAFEQAVESADRLADRRDEEAKRLAAVAEQEDRISALERDIGEARAQVAEARAGSAAASDAWISLGRGLGIEAVPGAGDLGEFLAAREIVLDRRAERDTAEAALAAEAQRQEALRGRFQRLLPERPCGTLAEALAAAQARLAAEAAAAQRHDRAEARLDELRKARRGAADGLARAEAALAAWRDDWDRCLGVLGRSEEDAPAAVETALDLIEAAKEASIRLQDLDHRIAGMRQNIAGFAARLGALCAAAAPDLVEAGAEAAVRALRPRLGTARAIEARIRLLLDQRRGAEADLDTIHRKRDEAEAGLAALRAMIGGASDAEAALRLERAQRRADSLSRLGGIAADLATAGEGRSIEALQREADAADPAPLDIRLARLQDEDHRLTREREIAAAAEQQLLSDRDRMTSAETALEAEEGRQAAAASCARISAEALVFHAAACLLQKGLERLRRASDSGLVPRVGAAFARITGGAYGGVAADEDEAGTPFLTALEADGTPKRVDELSEGTRDQLFLALRLVMLEDYAAKAPPLPFIADDLLQTFDETRTRHALLALADLSRHVQVIVLTHHRHLLDIAATLPPGIVHRCAIGDG